MTTDYRSTADTAARYGIGIDLLRTWRRYEAFPLDAIERRGTEAFFDVTKLDEWLRCREVNRVGRKARWLATVGHKDA